MKVDDKINTDKEIKKQQVFGQRFDKKQYEKYKKEKLV